jgi:hypothetical protein
MRLAEHKPLTARRQAQLETKLILAFSGFQLLIFSVSILLPLLCLLVLATTEDSDGPPRTDETGWSFTFPELSAEEFASRLAPLSCLTWPLFFGHIFVGLNSLRSKVYGGGYCAIGYDTFDGGETDEERVRFRDFLSGYYLYFPLLGLLSVHGLLVLSGPSPSPSGRPSRFRRGACTDTSCASSPSCWSSLSSTVSASSPSLVLSLPFRTLLSVLSRLFGLRQDKRKESACFMCC